MTQHTDLIERLRASSEDGLTPDDAYAAANALEAQARELERLCKDAALVAARERERIAAWIEPQRNDIPACGFEFAAAIRALNTEGEGNEPSTQA
ncbi:hypothetical protein [Acidovorax sp. SD340]|uniref:hypothetical protein n=1 Tax=Acidovorax sp. SD340 TaxID=1690268 RepID=UPI0006DCC66A|nr:hypothetical protein [Acidovorax sp. SD340]KQB59319.1 hypothetical protein AE621_10345 [Acidovorax sp. SD340]MBO1007152.1 hypothetical protein [Acidovorax sp. SD340]